MPPDSVSAGHNRAPELADELGAPLSRIGLYRIVRLLGRGGMGAVYLAEQDVPVRREVAVKVLSAGIESERFVARFEAERQALALMEHPNITSVFDAGVTDSGLPYFVMERVSGSPLTQYCDQHRLGVAQRLELFRQICHAVQHAHQKGIIHRDLKPSNVIVSDAGGEPACKVIDFGIAKAMGVADATRLTLTGVSLGTPAYMSPEQARGDIDVDTRSDVEATPTISLENRRYTVEAFTTLLLQERVQYRSHYVASGTVDVEIRDLIGTCRRCGSRARLEVEIELGPVLSACGRVLRPAGPWSPGEEPAAWPSDVVEALAAGNLGEHWPATLEGVSAHPPGKRFLSLADGGGYCRRCGDGEVYRHRAVREHVTSGALPAPDVTMIDPHWCVDQGEGHCRHVGL